MLSYDEEREKLKIWEKKLKNFAIWIERPSLNKRSTTLIKPMKKKKKNNNNYRQEVAIAASKLKEILENFI